MAVFAQVFLQRNRRVDPALERFSIEKKEMIGEGISSEVYNGVDKVDGRLVACKRMEVRKNKRLREKVEAEVDKLRELDHPNIVRLIASGMAERKYVIVMERLSKSLREVVDASEGGLETKLATQYLGDLLRGLSYCHGRGIIHRDIKLENAMVDVTTGQAKLIDFGLAIRAGSTEESSFELVGTKPYIAPEVLANRSYTFESDMWSMGVLFFVMIFQSYPFSMAHTLNKAFRSLSEAQLEHRQLSVLSVCAKPGVSHELPPQTSALFDAMLQVAPELRASADDILEQLALGTSAERAARAWRRVKTVVKVASTVSRLRQ